ncbi:MAG TPA: ribosome-associated translation inhibitor RaiA [Verrucomicrobiae bacterium]
MAKIIAPSKKLDFSGNMEQIIYMKFILTTHNVTLTKAIEDHILSRVDKLEHLDRYCTSARVSLEHDHLKRPEKQFTCAIRLAVPGPDLYAVDCKEDLYAAIDVVTKKIEQQLRKRHNKFKARKHAAGARGKEEQSEAEL